MQRSCISGLVYFLVVGVVYFLIVHQFTHQSLAAQLVLAAACAGFTGIFLGGLLGVPAVLTQRAAVARSRRNEALQDGRLEVVTGPAQPLGLPLQSPFTQAPSAAYAYKVSHIQTSRSYNSSNSQTTRQSSTVMDYSGYAITPSVVQSPRGIVHLRGFMDLKTFDANLDQAAAQANARTYVASTNFEDVDLMHSLGKITGLIGNNDEALRQDLRMQQGDLEPNRLFEEQRLSVGELVTAMGYYSTSQNAFVPHWTWNFLEDGSNRIFKGDGQAALKSIVQGRIVSLVFGLLGVLVTHLILLALIFG